MSDFLWDIATSGVARHRRHFLLASLVVACFPLLKWLPMIGPYVPVAKLVSYLALALLLFLFGFRVADGRAEAKALRATIEANNIDLEAASEAAKEADAARPGLGPAARKRSHSLRASPRWPLARLAARWRVGELLMTTLWLVFGLLAFDLIGALVLHLVSEALS